MHQAGSPSASALMSHAKKKEACAKVAEVSSCKGHAQTTLQRLNPQFGCEA